MPENAKTVAEIVSQIFAFDAIGVINSIPKIIQKFSDSKEKARNPQEMFQKFKLTIDFAVSAKKFLKG
jgi:hypothetical protein